MSTTSKFPIDTSSNISKLYIDRIKRENEEDQWISGEELYTDGSSDDEEKGVAKSGSRNTRRQGGSRGGARPKAQTSKRPDVPPLAPPSLHKEEGGSDSADEQPIDISWKPKRGSIRLPHVITGTETHTDLASDFPKQ